MVWGGILILLGVMSLAGSAQTNNHEGDWLAVIMLLSGGALAFFGWQHTKRSKEAAGIALQMIREEGKLDAAQLAQRMDMSEVDIRGFVAEAQRKGIISFKVEIV